MVEKTNPDDPIRRFRLIVTTRFTDGQRLGSQARAANVRWVHAARSRGPPWLTTKKIETHDTSSTDISLMISDPPCGGPIMVREGRGTRGSPRSAAA